MKTKISQENRDAMANSTITFARRLQERLKQERLTQEKFAEQSELGFGTIKKTIGLKSVPKLDTAVRIAKELDCSLDYLCGIGEVEEITHKKANNAATILSNLHHVITDANLIVTLQRSPTTGTLTTITTSNPFIFQFLSQITENTSEKDVKELIKQFKGYRVLESGEIVDKETYMFHMYNNFIRDAYMKHDVSEKSDNDFIDEQNKLWIAEHGAIPHDPLKKRVINKGRG